MSFDIIKKILKNYFQINVVDFMNITVISLKFLLVFMLNHLFLKDIDDKIINKAIQVCFLRLLIKSKV